MSLEAVTAAPINHHILYQDGHVRLLEVTLWPGDKEKMHGHAYPSVFAFDAVQPAMVNDRYPGSAGGPPKFGASIRPPGVPEYPRCQTMGPQAPHAATVQANYPQHFYRMEFLRLDGERDFASHWREWYPDWAVARRPSAVGRSSRIRSSRIHSAGRAGWSYPAALDAVNAAPDNARVLYAGRHVRVVEVMVRPGERVPLSGWSHPAVLAYDTPQPNTPGGATIVIDNPTPQNALSVSRPRQYSVHPDTWNFPTCESVGAIAPYRMTNTGTVPLHYYRIEFNWIDGDHFPRVWKAHFPIMGKGPRPAL